MAYLVFRKSGAEWLPVSRGFAKRSAAESRRHAIARHQPEWELEVREQQANGTRKPPAALSRK